MKTNFVKKFIFLFALISLLVVNGCKKLDIEKKLRIDIGTQFQNDVVTIKLDNDVIFSDSVSTNPILWVSKILKFDYPIGKYEMSVNVNGIEKRNKVRHKNNRYIYIIWQDIFWNKYYISNRKIRLRLEEICFHGGIVGFICKDYEVIKKEVIYENP